MPIGLILMGGMVCALALMGWAYEHQKVELVQTQSSLTSLVVTHDQTLLADKNLKALNDTQGKLIVKQDQDISQLQETQNAILNRFNKEHADVLHAKASDDGVAAPVLKYVAGSMRKSTDEVRNNNQASVSTVQDRSQASGTSNSGSDQPKSDNAVGSGSGLLGHNKSLSDIFGPKGHPPKGH